MENTQTVPVQAPVRRRISRLHDARAVRSRAALRQALLDLIDIKQFDQISIKDITEQAKVSYPVFFRQFSSKEELLADIATEQVRNLLEQGRAVMKFGEGGSSDDLCGYVQSHRKLWATLLSAGASAVMRNEFSRISKEIANTELRSNPVLPVDLVAELVTNAIFDILAWWMRQSEDYPRENVETLLNALVIDVYTRPMKIKLK